MPEPNEAVTVDFDPNKPPYKQPKRPFEEHHKEVPKLKEFSADELKDILDEHKKWLDSKGKIGKPADLATVNLEGENLSHAILQEGNLSGANLRGVILAHANLEGAYLWNANLEGAYLVEANFQGATLESSNLDFAQLDNSDLQGANLSRASIQKTNFARANLQGANLNEAIIIGAAFNATTLREANFQDAEFSESRGLLANQFAGTNVSGAKLQNHIAKFEGLGQVEKISQRAQKLFLSLLLVCIYCWLTIATTTDAELLTNSGSSPLPIIQTKIPIVGIYVTVPLMLLSLYFWFNLYLQRLWERLSKLPAVFPDGEALDEKIYPWLVSGLVRTNFRLLQKRPLALSGLQSRISIFLAWWLVPLTLVFFWLRYLPKHDWQGTSEHILLLVVTFVFAAWFQDLAKRTLRGQEQRSLNFRENWRKKELWTNLGQRSWKSTFLGLLLVLLTTVVSDGAINGISPPKTEEYNHEISIYEKENGEVVIQLSFPVFSYVLENPQNNVISKKDEKNKEGIEQKENNEWVSPFRLGEKIKLVSIPEKLEIQEQKQRLVEDKRSGMHYGVLFLLAKKWYRTRIPDLLSSLPLIQTRAFANFREKEVSIRPANWFLMREPDAEDISEIITGAILQEENLKGIDAEQAFLMNADMRKVNLIDANLKMANLKKANLHSAKLQNADLTKAELQNVNLSHANLQNANLKEANLQNANLAHATLENSNLIFANLSKANLFYANLSGAHLEGNNLQNVELRGANMKGVHLSLAKLQKVELSGLNLMRAELVGAYLQKANLEGANLQHANLGFAHLQGTNLRWANLNNVLNLTQAQLNQACVNEETILPEGLIPPEPCLEEELSPK